MISVLIPTRNEERDLPGCLASVAWSDDVHVYDCYSTDRTLEIARGAGATVTTRPHDPSAGPFGGDESLHRNWALANLPFRHPWVLHVDADERVTSELRRSIAAAAADPQGRVAFRVQRRDYLDGRWLRRVQASPYYLRLFRPEHVRFERVINPVAVVDGPIGLLDGALEHHPFSKGIAHWLERHNGYSTGEARQIAANRAQGRRVDPIAAFLARDFGTRRFHQKELLYRLPARPLVKFLLLYVVKRGFLDGRAGLTYALLQSFYEYMIVLKTRELEAATPASARASAPTVEPPALRPES